jgi:glyoxylase-like metal-dependent hydrolase (beta-lactamase superfamily II)
MGGKEKQPEERGISLNMQQLDLGGITISWLNGGEFKLDGGTMFGAVPKLLWSRKYPPDDENYIQMLAAPLLVRTAQAAILIDTGIGNKLTEKQKQIFRVNRDWTADQDLACFNLTPQDIDAVILTHCDFDHAGGIVRHNADGRPELTFPRARHIINAMEWQDVHHTNSRSVHTYFPENFEGLEASGLVELATYRHEVADGVRVSHSGGHTRGHQVVEITGRSGCALHLGDLMPTHAHANPLWIMAYDNFPLEVISQKEHLIAQNQDRGCWFTFYHDDFMNFGKMDEQGQIS